MHSPAPEPSDFSDQKPDQENERMGNTHIIQLLQAEWSAAVRNLELALHPAEAVFDDLIAHYSQPTRAYHNVEHIHAMLTFLSKMTDQMEHPSEVTLAVFFHDGIYDSEKNNNEEESANYAVSALTKLGAPDEAISLVRDLVLSTHKHLPLRDGFDNAIFLDADLSILASSPEQYQRYSAGIKTEYSWVPEEVYGTRRAEVMSGFLERESIFFTEEAKSILQAQAERNVRAEIASYTSVS